MSERWWKAGPFKDEDGVEYYAIRRSPIGLTVAERVYDPLMADRIVSLHVEHQTVTGGKAGLSDEAGESEASELPDAI
jgi:hypothetical protein